MATNKLPTMWWIIKGDLNVVMDPNWSRPELAVVIKSDKNVQLDASRMREIEEMKAIGLGEWTEVYLPWGQVEECLARGYSATPKIYNRNTDVASHFDLSVEGESIIINLWYAREVSKLAEKGRVRIRRTYPKALIAEKAMSAWERLDALWREERESEKAAMAMVEVLEKTAGLVPRLIRNQSAAKQEIGKAVAAVHDLLRLLADAPVNTDSAAAALKALVDTSSYYINGMKQELADLAEARKRAASAEQAKVAEPPVVNTAPKVNETKATENVTNSVAKEPEAQPVKTLEDDSSAKASETKSPDAAPAPTPPAAPALKARKPPVSKQERVARQAADGQVSTGATKLPKVEPPKTNAPPKKGFEALGSVVVAASSTPKG